MKRILSLITAVTVAFASIQAQTPAEDCGSATVFTGAAPWTAIGSTVGAVDNYNEVCPYTPTGGLDEVIAWNPPASGYYDLNLCNGTTNFDTKLYVYEGSCPASAGTGVDIACNDDNDEACTNMTVPWTSILRNVFMNAGTTYYIVVDAYSGTDVGNYTLVVIDAVAPPTGNDLAQGEGRLSNYTWRPNYNNPAVPFAAVISNEGGTTFTNAISTMNVFSDADGFVTPIFTDASAPISIAPTAVEVVTGSTAYAPSANGVYIYEWVVSADGFPDDVSSNDTFAAIYVVNDTFQERSTAFLLPGIAATRLAVLDPSAEYGVVQSYGTDVDVIGATILVSVDPVYLAEPITANLYEVLGGDVDSLSLVTSGAVPADTGALVYDIPITASLAAGDYILAYAGQSYPVNTPSVYTQGASDLLRAVVTGGFWGFFAGPYAWSQVLWTEEAVVACNSNNVPTNQSHTQLANRFELNWDPTPAAVACQVNGQRLPTGPSPSVNILGGDISTTNVPFAAAGAGNTYMWRVRCACSISPLDVSAFTVYGDTFTVPVARQGDLAEVNLSMFPNPADNQLVVGMESVAGNANVSVIDMLGRVAIARTENMVDGYNNFTLDVSGLEPGAYFLRMEDGENTRVEEFTVAR